MGNVGWAEIIAVAFFGLLLFAPSQFSKLAKSLGNTLLGFKKAVSPGATPQDPQAAAPQPMAAAPAARRRSAPRPRRKTAKRRR
jgi:Sec-independent protein translocase protein TatA